MNIPITDDQIQVVPDYLDREFLSLPYVLSWNGMQVLWFRDAPHHEVHVTWTFFRDCPDYGLDYEAELRRLGLAERIRKAGDQQRTFIVSWGNGCATLTER